HRPAEAGLHARHDEPAPERGDDRAPGERERRGRRALLHAISPLTSTRSSAVSRWSGPMVKSPGPTLAPRPPLATRRRTRRARRAAAPGERAEEAERVAHVLDHLEAHHQVEALAESAQALELVGAELEPGRAVPRRRYAHRLRPVEPHHARRHFGEEGRAVAL